MEIQDICKEIKLRWPSTIRTMPEAVDDLFAMSAPYIVPCSKGSFQEYYYWDTYFACRGLALQGAQDMVKNCCDNFISLVERYGFIPNGGRKRYLNRSQPPVFSLMVDMVVRAGIDYEWCVRALEALLREHEFWMTRRLLPVGLNHYGQHECDEKLMAFGRYVMDRLQLEALPEHQSLIEFGANAMAETESGWDFNPRFDRRCLDFAPVDLNSLLGNCERIIAFLANELGMLNVAAEYNQKLQQRIDLMRRFCWDSDRGVFVDYDVRNSCRSTLTTGAAVWPLWLKLATQEEAEATKQAVEKYLEYPFGIVACEKRESGCVYQWDYPNAWPPVQLACMEGFAEYGFDIAAERIADKYLKVISRNFDATGEFWEKYNGVEGSIQVGDEYQMPAMLGWTAGVFIVAAKMIDSCAECSLCS